MFQRGWKGEAKGFKIAVRQNRTDVEANVKAVCRAFIFYKWTAWRFPILFCDWSSVQGFFFSFQLLSSMEEEFVKYCLKLSLAWKIWAFMVSKHWVWSCSVADPEGRGGGRGGLLRVPPLDRPLLLDTWQLKITVYRVLLGKMCWENW